MLLLFKLGVHAFMPGHFEINIKMAEIVENTPFSSIERKATNIKYVIRNIYIYPFGEF